MKILFIMSMFVINGYSFECKGLVSSTCKNSDSCYWVSAFTRKDGAQVKGHCRKNPGNKKNTSLFGSKKNKSKKKKVKKEKKTKKEKIKKEKKSKKKKKKSKKKKKESAK